MMNTIVINPSKNKWPELIQRPQLNNEELESNVSEILKTVKQEGNKAVKNYALQFDGFAPDNLLVTPDEILAATIAIDKNLKNAILVAKKNIEKFHSIQVEKDREVETMPGVVCWRKSIPIEKVGLYIPGGTAPLFSTLLMLAVPAHIAGCTDITVCTPAHKSGKISVAILFVAQLLGIKKIYKLGGAHAIAAMGYGTETIEKVNKIFGPGNQFVTCAKKLINQQGVAIDMLAGPSELAVYADETCVPEFVAADLLSQAEHGPDSQVILVASTQKIIEQVNAQLQIQSKTLTRKDIAGKSIMNSRLIVFEKTVDAFDFLNDYAPEHLMIASKRAKKIVQFGKKCR